MEVILTQNFAFFPFTFFLRLTSPHLTPPHRPRVVAELVRAKRRPIFPKHTQLQNRTLSIQIPVSTVSWLAKPPSVSGSAKDGAVPFRCRPSDEKPAGVGTICGFNPIKMAEPVKPTAAESRKPGFDRSIRYQRKGLTSARVRETCIVDAHGSFRYRIVRYLLGSRAESA